MVAQTATTKARTAITTGLNAVKMAALVIIVLLAMLVLMTAPIGLVWPLMAIDAFTAGNILGGIAASAMTIMWLAVLVAMKGPQR